MDGLLIFGGINLIIALIAYKFAAKSVENPECSAEVQSVRCNKTALTIYMIIAILMVVVGLVGLLLDF